MVLRHCPPSRLIGPSVIQVHGVARSAQCLKETFALPASFAGQARYPPDVLVIRSLLCLISFPRWPALRAARCQLTVRSTASINSTFLPDGRRNPIVNTCCYFSVRS